MCGLLSGLLGFAASDGPGEAECPAARAPGHLGMDLRAWRPQALTGIAVCTAPGLVGKVRCKESRRRGWLERQQVSESRVRAPTPLKGADVQ